MNQSAFSGVASPKNAAPMHYHHQKKKNTALNEVRMFAKLYGNDVDQILVLLGTNDEGNPEVSFYYQPEGRGVLCTVASWDENSDETQNKAKKAFDAIDETYARRMVKKMCDLQGFKMPANNTKGEGTTSTSRLEKWF